MSEETVVENSSFVWDETTQLYFHSSSGFYYNPQAGWYYSSRDGLYYTFHNGSYVLLSSQHIDVGDVEDSGLNEECSGGENWSEFDNSRCAPSVCDDTTSSGRADCQNNQDPELPPPPSEWLEETLINLYLPGHNRSVNATDDPMVSFDADGADDQVRKLEEDDGIAGICSAIDQDENITAYSEEEENWRLQYGQVVHSEEESTLGCVAVDLWDWEIVTYPEKAGQCQAARLLGRLVKQSNKLHPSMPCGGLFKTAPISEVHLDLVRVRTGKVYRLHSPSAKYLTSVPTYDSSNPTKDWSFPELSMSARIPQTNSRGTNGPKSADSRRTSVWTDELSESKSQKDHPYRDRAGERRKLHGGFGIGHGQKSLRHDEVGGSSSLLSTEEAAAEALNISLGPDSYARKILQNMGWKEGEALGKTMPGLAEPLKAVGNVGTSGLGWKDIRHKYS